MNKIKQTLRKKIVLIIGVLLISTIVEAQVWPADANNNGIVNNVDFIFTGLAIETGGPSRLAIDQGVSWSEKPANDWTNSFPSLGLNYKHADANGNGWIDGGDLYSVNEYYDTTNVNFTVKMGDVLLGNDLYFTFSDTIIEAGDTITIKINLGTSANPISNLHGIAFSVNLDTSKIIEDETIINFHGGWLGTPDVDLFTFDKYNPLVNATRADFAATRGSFGMVSGSGEIGEITVITEDDLAGKMQDIINSIEFEFENVIGIDTLGYDMNITSKNKIVSVSDGITLINSSLKDNTVISVFPNPTNQLVNINSNYEINELKFFDLSGKEIDVQLINNQIDITKINCGIYYMHITTDDNFVQIKKIIKRL